MSSTLSWRRRRSADPARCRTARTVRLGVAVAFGSAALLVLGAGTASADPGCPTTSSGAAGDVAAFTFTPASCAAGSDPSISSSISFNYQGSTTDSVKSVTVALPPGLLASLGAVPDLCTPAELEQSVPACPAGSEIGTGSLEVSALGATIPSTVTLYMMPAPSSADVSGVGAEVTFPGPPPFGLPLVTTTGYVAVSEVGNAPVLDLVLPDMPNTATQGGKTLQVQLEQMSFTINGTAPTSTGSPSTIPFTRLPSSCSAATTTLTVQTYAASSPNGTASSSFTPTGCSGPGAIGFSANVSATATKDSSDPGVTLVTKVTTNPAQAADKSLTLIVPAKALPPDVFNAAHLFGKAVGSVVAQTSLMPTPLVGTVTLTGTISAPSLTITFPPPFAISFSGAINIVGDSVSFQTVPDVPVSSLTVTLNGGATAMFYTNCLAPTGTLSAALVGQDGTSTTQTLPISVAGCQARPSRGAKLSGASLRGLRSGKRALAFALTAGSRLVNLRAFTISLPGGLSFDAATYKHALSVSGAQIKSVVLSHGRLVVRLRSSVSSLSVRLTPKAFLEQGSLAERIKRRKLKSLTARVVATNAAGHSVTLRAKLPV